MLRRGIILATCVWLWSLLSFGQNPPPALISVSPAAGSTSGGTAVTLSGSNFLTGAEVTFGGKAATNVVVVNTSTITATTPGNPAGAVSVVITNPDGQTSVAPPLTNAGFESGNTGWQFKGTGAESIVTNSAQAHSGQNFAQLNSGTANHPYLSALLASGNSQYLPVNPGDTITLGGWTYRVAGDGTDHWVLQVTDANESNPIYVTTPNVTSGSWTFYQKSYTIPSTGRYARFYCEIINNTIAATANFDDAIFSYTPIGSIFNYQIPPTLAWIGPNFGPANSANPVQISGANFAAGDQVTFGGVAAVNVSVVNSTTITAQTPMSAPGAVNVVVTNPSGIPSTPAVTYTFNPGPAVTTVTPATGPLAGGTSLVISGANFLPGAKVTLGGTAALNVVSNGASITAVTPAHTAGQVDVVITNPDGQSATASGAYAYQQPAPLLATISPATGSTNGGTTVTLSGMNFLAVPSVTFGGVPATVISASPAAIGISTPAATQTGAVDVTITNSDGQNSTLTGGFNYVAPGPTPTVSSISSPQGPTAGGSSITINGSNFVTGASITFGGMAATNVVVTSSSVITATTPPHAAGRVNVTVTNPDGQSATLYGIVSPLPNPDFDSAPNWQFVGSGNAAVTFDPANAEDGDDYALVTSNPGGPATYYATDASGVNQYFPVSPGDVISFGGGVYRLSGNGSANYTLGVKDANKDTLMTVRTTPTNASTPVWTNMLGTYTMPAGAAYVRLGAQIRDNTVTAQVRFDGTILQRMPAGAGYTYVGPDLPGVFTYHYDNLRSGVNASETTLAPYNVNKQQFGKKFSFPVDGWIDASPLYVANVSIGGVPHNVVYVATEHNSVYAFDADGLQSTSLWQTSFINPSAGVTTIPTSDLVSGGIAQPEFGIMATPVIDPVAGTIFVLARTKESGNYVQRLHALDITTGAERLNSPVMVQVTLPGTGVGSQNGMVVYDSYVQNVRPAMALVNGAVYFAAASLEDLYAYHGWVLGYDAQSLSLVGAYCVTPNGSRGGIWQSGGGITADAAGNLYVQTGNGTFNANYGGQDYGDSILKLQLSSAGLNVVDYFTPYNQSALNQQDLDVASGAALLLPDQPGPHVHELIGGGKQGALYVLDRDAMGGFNAAGDTQIVQALPGALTPTTSTVDAGLWSTPISWNNMVYVLGRNDVMKAFALQNGQLVGPIFKGSTTYLITESLISSNGPYNGILWVSQSGGNVLRAFDPYDLTREYYDTAQAGTRDAPGGITGFMMPTVVNGKVYIGTRTELDVYGLF
jgi:IPT/TIG domain-containing protein/carbohydrate binding protein with CBM4/9 domain